MKGETDRTQWEARLVVWRKRLRDWGLDGFAAALLDAAEPVGPLGAQALYVVQPTLGVLFPSSDVAAWARLIEDPANIAWMRERLLDSDELAQSPAEEGTPDGSAD